MKSMSADQLHNLIEAKPKWELAELLQALEEEGVGQAALDMLRKLNRENEDGANL